MPLGSMIFDAALEGVGRVSIRLLGFGVVRSDAQSATLLRFQDGGLVLGWLLTSVVGLLVWISGIALVVHLIR